MWVFPVSNERLFHNFRTYPDFLDRSRSLNENIYYLHEHSKRYSLGITHLFTVRLKYSVRDKNQAGTAIISGEFA